MTPKNITSDLILKEECYSIVGACFEVYKNKGCGFHEPVYQECLAIEFEHCQIPAIALPGLSLEYRGQILGQKFFPDFVCYAKIVVELKAVTELCDEHRAQVLNYLKAGNFELGLLINFGHYPKLQYERFANTRQVKGSDEPIYL
ncbi:MAG TPA: GxxExxY protein [Chthoniobacterales bacterium]|nr:GxxExxY protein [Chthoniobacterales bacterium]